MTPHEYLGQENGGPEPMKGPDVEIFEVGPRDGLQNEARIIPVVRKVALIDCLSRAGFRRIEAGSFVSAKWVPQMADSDQVFASIKRAPGIRYVALAPNLKGFEAARAAGVDEVAIFAAASEAFSRANLNCSISDSLERFAPVAEGARDAGIALRGYVSCVTDCPFDGPVAPASVARVVAALRELGCHEISLGETIGQGRPDTVDAMLRAALNEAPVAMLAGHFHDTGGQALPNVDVALDHGLRVFDAAVGGLGGCPYAPGAPGNVATEKLAAHLGSRGFQTGLDLTVLAHAADMARALRAGG